MYRWCRSVVAVVIASFILADSALAVGKVGIVLMHGKSGSPDQMRHLAGQLTAAGYLVATPEMPWSRARSYDRSLADAHVEIDASIATLRTQGADRVAIAGHSMGGNMAMGYAATHSGLAAVMAIGPGQTVEAPRFLEQLGASVARAKALIAEGRGKEKAAFADLHLGRSVSANTTAEIYDSYFDPDGLANMTATATVINVPFLWIVGTRDQNMMARGRAYAFDLVPANRLNRYVEVLADHMGTPDASAAEILEWLKSVFP